MCLSPIRIRNRARHYDGDSMQRLWLTVPCGHCAECLAAKRREWYLRNYWQCRECFDKGGFVLFDTLTYDDEHLPHLSRFIPQLSGTESDFSCFDKRDLDLFMNQLRTSLSRMGYSVGKNLGYFYSTEYGSDGEYIDDRGRSRVASFRPHYHFLFYSRVPGLTPDVLAMTIYDSWRRGRTDCVHDGYLRRGYVYNHNVFSAGYGRTDDKSLRRVSSYVAKYVTKDPDYKSKIESRISQAFEEIFASDMYDVLGYMAECGCESVKELEGLYYKIIKKYVDMFSHTSKHFGEYALTDDGVLKDIDENGYVLMPDEMKVKVPVPVPLYYVRKLYCRLVEPIDGQFSWTWKPKGKEWKRRSCERAISHLQDRLASAYWNMSPDDKVFVQQQYLLEHHDRFRHLAEYELFMRDRFSPVTKPVDYSLAVECTPRFYPHGNLWQYVCDEDGSLYRLKSADAKDKERFLSDCYSCDYEYVSPDEEKELLIGDFTMDNVLDCFASYFKPLNEQKQRTFDKKEEVRKKFKNKK